MEVGIIPHLGFPKPQGLERDERERERRGGGEAALLSSACCHMCEVVKIPGLGLSQGITLDGHLTSLCSRALNLVAVSVTVLRRVVNTTLLIPYYWLLLLFATVGISDITACWLQISKNWPLFVLVLVCSMEKHVLDRLMLEL